MQSSLIKDMDDADGSFFDHIGGRIPKVDSRNYPIDADSPRKREIYRAVKFLFKIKSHAHLTVRLTEAQCPTMIQNDRVGMRRVGCPRLTRRFSTRRAKRVDDA
jgi:hypothetical protein